MDQIDSPVEAIAYAPVWVSSREHLDKFQRIRDATPWYRILFGGSYAMPAEFPCIAIGSRKTPIVYFSSGVLEISDAGVSYDAQQPRSSVLSTGHANLNTTLSFSIGDEDRPIFTRFKSSKSYFSINWIGLGAFGRSTLLCVGGRGPDMSKINEATDSLFGALQFWVDAHSD